MPNVSGGRDAGAAGGALEVLVGLKIQALVNDPLRAVADWDDIRMMLPAAGRQRQKLDWELLLDYLRLFQMEERLGELKSIHGTIEQD